MHRARHPFPRWLLAAWFVSLAVALLTAGIWPRWRGRAAMLLVDPTTAAGAPPWFGAVSTVGVLALAIAGTSLVFAGAVLRRARHDPDRAGLLLHTGALVSVATLDDAFLIHEHWLLRLGVPDAASYTAYLVWSGAVASHHRRAIRSVDWRPFALAGAALAVSVVLDLWFAVTDPPAGYPAFEDLPKLWGLLLFAVGATRESFRAVSGHR